MIVFKTAFGTDFVGLFLQMAGGRLLHPARLPEKELPEGVECTPVPAESDMLGIFFAGNSNGVVGGLEWEGATLLEGRHTAVGNLVRANDHGALLSPLLEGQKGVVEEALGVPATVTTVAGLNLVGSTTLANNNAAVVHPEATPAEKEAVSEALGVPAYYGKLVKSGFLGAMAVANDRLLLTSPSAMSPEVARVAEVLGMD